MNRCTPTVSSGFKRYRQAVSSALPPSLHTPHTHRSLGIADAGDDRANGATRSTVDAYKGCPRTPTEGWTSCSSRGHTGGHGIWCPGRCGYPNRCPVGAIERIFKCASFWFLDVRMRTSKWQGKWPFCTLRWQNFPPPAGERGLRRRLRRALMEDLPLRRAKVPPDRPGSPKIEPSSLVFMGFRGVRTHTAQIGTPYPEVHDVRAPA